MSAATHNLGENGQGALIIARTGEGGLRLTAAGRLKRDEVYLSAEQARTLKELLE